VAASDDSVTLRPITRDTVRAIVALAVAPEQRGYVADNATSLAEALFSPEAWYRAIYLGDEPAGFVMLYDESLRPDPPAEPEMGVWRFMVDQRYQRRGVGAAALDLVVAHAREQGCRTLTLSYLPGEHAPEAFYLRAGFRHTGQVDDGEVVLELPLSQE
jgi:diamine N-acetyltransferase